MYQLEVEIELRAKLAKLMCGLQRILEMEQQNHELFQSEGALQLLITPDFIGRIDGAANVDDVPEDEANVEDDELPSLEDDEMPDLEEADSSSETDVDHHGEEEELLEEIRMEGNEQQTLVIIIVIILL